jgi:hypothetical protein
VSLAEAGVVTLSLPETIAAIGAGAFSGAEASGGGKIALKIPLSVMEKLPEEVKAELEKDSVSEGEDNLYTEIPIPADIQTLAEALAWIGGNAKADGGYTVTVKADETIPAQSLFYDGKRVSLTLKGDTAEREVSLSGSGSLFTVESGVPRKKITG